MIISKKKPKMKFTSSRLLTFPPEVNFDDGSIFETMMEDMADGWCSKD